MTLGTNETKKVAFLGVLVVVMAYFMDTNLFSGPDIPASSSAPPSDTARPTAALPVPEGAPGPRTVPRSRNRSEEFHPTVLNRKRGEQPIDPTTIDPTL